jgi:hypothetical protein
MQVEVEEAGWLDWLRHEGEVENRSSSAVFLARSPQASCRFPTGLLLDSCWEWGTAQA